MRIAVLGAGNGGLATAVHAAMRGCDVRLFSRSPGRLAAFSDTRVLGYAGVLGAGTVQLAYVGTDLREATAGADLIIACVPSTELEDYGQRLAEVVTPDAVILLNPGGTFGSLRLFNAMHAHRPDRVVPIAEFSTLAYAARASAEGDVYISNLVEAVPAGVFPAALSPEARERVGTLYPSAAFGESVLSPALLNLNPIEHPAQTILNAGRIESTSGDFYFYIDGTTPAVGRVIDDTDRERRKICAAYGIDTPPFVDLFASAGYTTADAAATGSAYEALQASEANRTFRSPATLEHRYVLEDIGHSLVTWEYLAALADVSTPVISSLISITESMMGTDYRAGAPALFGLAPALRNPGDLRGFLADGVPPAVTDRRPAGTGTAAAGAAHLMPSIGEGS